MSQAPSDSLKLSTSQRLREYALLMRLDKPIGILLLLWPTLWGLWIAGQGSPDWWILTVFVAGVVLMRSAGCVINDYADRDFDGHVERTQHRPLAAGRIHPKEALGLFALLCLIAFAMVLTLDAFTIALAPVGALLAASYPFMKRVTNLPQFYLGAAFGWAIPMAFAAQTGSIPLVAWALFVVTLMWSVVYDTFYAMVDRDDDLKIGIKSTAILFGDADRLWIGIFQTAMIAILIWIGLDQNLGPYYYAAVAIGAGLFVHQQWISRERDRARCFQAFIQNNRFGAVIFLGLLLDYAL